MKRNSQITHLASVSYRNLKSETRIKETKEFRELKEAKAWAVERVREVSSDLNFGNVSKQVSSFVETTYSFSKDNKSGNQL